MKHSEISWRILVDYEKYFLKNVEARLRGKPYRFVRTEDPSITPKKVQDMYNNELALEAAGIEIVLRKVRID